MWAAWALKLPWVETLNYCLRRRWIAALLWCVAEIQALPQTFGWWKPLAFLLTCEECWASSSAGINKKIISVHHSRRRWCQIGQEKVCCWPILKYSRALDDFWMCEELNTAIQQQQQKEFLFIISLPWSKHERFWKCLKLTQGFLLKDWKE